MDLRGYIYLIRNLVNGKGYVGQTRTTLKIRIRAHIRQAIEGSNLPLHSAIRKYGLENFSFLEVATCENLDFLNELEEHYIQFFGTFIDTGHGYNLTKGGKVCTEVSIQTRRKMSLIKKGKAPWNKGKLGSMTGNVRLPMRESSKLKLRLANLGKKSSPATKAKMSAVLTGRICSKETRAKIGLKNSVNLKGKPWSEARRNAQRKRV